MIQANNLISPHLNSIYPIPNSHSPLPPFPPSLYSFIHPSTPNLTIQIPSHRPPQLPSPIPSKTNQILQIITSTQPHFSDHIPRRTLQITIFLVRNIILGPAEIRVRGDRGRAFETLETGFGFGLLGWVVGVAAEEFVAGNGFLGGEFVAGVGFFFWFLDVR